MKNKWNTEKSGGGDDIGGWISFSNHAQGYHGLEQQWWEWYMRHKKNPRVLLISETRTVKSEFQKIYPSWVFTCTDLDGDADFDYDLCVTCGLENKYDLIICQATMEHLYDPFAGMKNMIMALKRGGVIVIHTHPQKFPYHSWPRDYFRFMDDWWMDMPKYLPVRLMEFHNHENYHEFICYKKK